MKKLEGGFNSEYKKLNKAQKEAVDSIDGPVMVVAGPGTGKTQILALRIGNILRKTDTKPDGILCLTFTNSGVGAMKERLVRYIGDTGEQVNVFTFHSFGMKVIEEYFKVLGLPVAPRLIEDTDRAIFFDQILRENEWEYLRPRGNSMRYFDDLKSLLSLLKRERVGAEDFALAIKKEIEFLEKDESSRSTRGSNKGELKKETRTKIEGLERSLEIVKFIDIYEKAKKEKNFLDYDDVLEFLVSIIEKSKDAAASMKERYLYILIDEHQDSSRVQNEFLIKVWGKVERPDIFVVGDDRQLIYGFSGASIEHFAGFQKTFKDAKLITLVDNYRSTQIILDASHELLKSVLTKERLKSQSKENHPIKLVEANTSHEEIVAAAMDIKGKTSVDPNNCAILVPKNREVREALNILHEYEVPIGSLEALNLFDQEEMHALLRVLKIITTGDPVALALSFFDKTSGLELLEADQFLSAEYMREFSFEKLLVKPPSLFSSNIDKWVKKLSLWKKESDKLNPRSLVQKIGEELFTSTKNKGLVSEKEILDTVQALLGKEIERNGDVTLAELVLYLERLASYGEHIPLITLPRAGVKVLTMHSSKGLEFDYVWIAHMHENSLNGGRRMGFTLPESIAEIVEERDIDAIKRKLYVAITRAKRFCTLSYAAAGNKGKEQELAKIIADLPKEVFKREKAQVLKKVTPQNTDLSSLVKLVKDKYEKRYVSVSLLNNFFECPWKWYFRNILQLPEAKTESLEFGNAVHQAIDQILRSRKEILPEDKEVAKIISRWLENRFKDISENRENEKSVSFKNEKFPRLNIYGKIDLVEYLDSDSVRVTDFKTGSVRKKSEIEKLDDEGRMSSYLRQLAMYSYLMKESTKNKINVVESRLEFLEAKDDKDIFYDKIISDEQIKLLLKDIADYDLLVKSGEWVNRSCHYNSYGRGTECEYCKLAEIYGPVVNKA